jgi:hypothetical protein
MIFSKSCSLHYVLQKQEEMLAKNKKLPKVINTFKKKEEMTQMMPDANDIHKQEAPTNTLKKKEENDANNADKQ